MKCKACDDKIDKGGNPIVSYERREFRGGGGYQGSYEYAKEELVDAGIFCSDTCLVNYLRDPLKAQGDDGA